jgi:hypothetical protein
MQLFNHFTTLIFLSAINLATACPCRVRQSSSTTSSATPASTSATVAATPTQDSFVGITPEQIKAVAPDTASCDGTQPCRTAEQAAPFINASFKKYNFTTVGEQAALFSLMAFESGNFRFDVNVFPGRPGQGSKFCINIFLNSLSE